MAEKGESAVVDAAASSEADAPALAPQKAAMVEALERFYRGILKVRGRAGGGSGGNGLTAH